MTRRHRRGRRPALVAALTGFIRSYVVMTEAQTLVVALWVIHTHCVEAFQQTPYLAVTSPEKQCGKSRLMEILNLLVARPWPAVLPSEAVLYRHVSATRPTLLFDEVDTVFKGLNDRYEGHRAILNAGHRKGTLVPRCFGPNQEVVHFQVFCPKVLAGIGGLPDTVADRSIPIRLLRKKPTEKVRRLSTREAEAEAAPLKKRVEKWVSKHRAGLGRAWPEMPDELSDRMREGCEPLVEIADALRIGKAARAALVEVLAAERVDSPESNRLRLLADLREIFLRADRKHGHRVEAIKTTDLLADLWAIDDAPWATYFGRGVDARDLARLLREYEIKPVPFRRKKAERMAGTGDVAKGYRRRGLEDAWQRYLPQPSNRSNRTGGKRGTK